METNNGNISSRSIRLPESERSTFSNWKIRPPPDNGLNFSHSSRHVHLASRSVTYIPHACSRIRSENSKHEIDLCLKFLITPAQEFATFSRQKYRKILKRGKERKGKFSCCKFSSYSTLKLSSSKDVGSPSLDNLSPTMIANTSPTLNGMLIERAYGSHSPELRIPFLRSRLSISQ